LPQYDANFGFAALGRVLINRGAADQDAFDVRYAPDSGAKADTAGLAKSANGLNRSRDNVP